MLTKTQIQQIAQRQHIGLATAERDYVQAIFLYLLYESTQDLLFKGGTCLRIVYRSNRFSDDLDFHAQGTVEGVRRLLQQSTRALQRFGVESATSRDWVTQQGYAFHLSFKGPLADARVATWGGIDIDVSLREEDLCLPPVRTFVSATTLGYDDVPSFTITHLSRADLFAEKVRALFERTKPVPRDLYDLWLMLQMGEPVNLTFINRKMARLRRTFEYDDFVSMVTSLQAGWDQDLRRLLPGLPPFEPLAQDVIEKFRVVWQDRHIGG